MPTAINRQQTTFRSRLPLFLALSRTPHGLIDMATPAMGALLSLGAFPPLGITILGLITAFSGYTAVYALNDVVGYKSDREKVLRGCFQNDCKDLDALLVRHPMAQGLLRFEEGLAWTLFWSVVALIGAWILNPVCVFIFLSGCLLETIYCLLWRISPFRTVVSGAVKTLGAVAAVFAVNPSPAPGFVTTLFLCLFFWEIGGQNVPNDWSDIHDDCSAGVKSIPVCFGTAFSRDLILITLSLTVPLAALLILFSPGAYPWPYPMTAMAVGIGLLIHPAGRLYRLPGAENAMALFNRSSYFPLSLFAISLAGLLF